MPDRIVTVKATRWFDAWARKIWTEAEYQTLREFVAEHPDMAPVIPGTGGARKLRWSVPGRGKRGGARIVYVFFMSEASVYLLTGYAKSDKADLSARDRKDIKSAIDSLKA